MNAVNDTPTTSGIANVTVNKDAPNTVINLLNSFSDMETPSSGLSYTVQSNTNPSLFTSIGISSGVLTMDYAPTMTGSSTITIRAKDAGNAYVDATFTVTVNSVNQAPVAAGDTYKVGKNHALSVSSPGVLGNDSDADGNGLTAVLTANVAHGTVTINPNGSFTYTPAANYTGSDGFTYKAFDGTVYSAIATVNIAVVKLGDIDHNESVDLRDAIMVMQLMCGISVDGIVIEADVNDDGKIGMAEAVYILGNVADSVP